jgi:hypothetical protein
MQRTLLTILLVMAASSPVSAASFCAVNTAQLEAALDAAESNNEDDIIRVQSGTYFAPSGGFDYFPAASDQNNDLEIIGGYGPNIGGPCQSGPFADPTLTELNGNNDANPMFRLGLPEEGGDIEIRNLLFVNGISAGNGGALRAQTALNGDPFPGRLTIENNIFFSNSGFIGGALYIQADGTSSMDIEVLNNLFWGNDAASVSGALQITAFAPPPPPGPVLTSLPAVTFAHNTVVNNNNDQSNIGGVRLSGDIPNVWVAGNNIWSNEGRGLQMEFESDNAVRLLNNNLQIYSSTNPIGVNSGNIGVAPTYVFCGPFCLEFVPTTDSPLIDAGYTPAFFFQPWELPETDLTGGPRQRGEQVDIGAYEGIPDVMFRDRFED